MNLLNKLFKEENLCKQKVCQQEHKIPLEAMIKYCNQNKRDSKITFDQLFIIKKQNSNDQIEFAYCCIQYIKLKLLWDDCLLYGKSEQLFWTAGLWEITPLDTSTYVPSLPFHSRLNTADYPRSTGGGSTHRHRLPEVVNLSYHFPLDDKNDLKRLETK